MWVRGVAPSNVGAYEATLHPSLGAATGQPGENAD